MKKLVFSSLLAVCIVMLSSCLDGDGENYQDMSVFGVAILGNSLNTLIKYNDYNPPLNITNSSASLIPDNCYWVYFRYEDEKNPDPATAGYWNVSLLENIVTVPKGSTIEIVDTANIKENEIPIASIYENTGMNYVGGYLFFSVAMSDIKEKQENRFEISYDLTKEPVESNGKRYYDMFIRVTKTTEGSGMTGNGAFTNAFPVKNLINHAINKEKEKDSTTQYINVRLNFIKEFNSSTNEPIWSTYNLTERLFPIPTES